MKIGNSNPGDVDSILEIYKMAVALQHEKEAVPWPTLDKDFVLLEIEEKRQWKMILDTKIACVWMTTTHDPEIWGEKDKVPSLYIHRIATNTTFRGKDLLAEVIVWSKNYALEQGKCFLRLDTVGINKRLIELYQRHGFNFYGIIEIDTPQNLPSHYHNNPVCLFEMELKK